MDGGDWIALGVGVASAFLAAWSLVFARAANQRADAANQRADEANVLSDEANRIAHDALALQKRVAPPEWSSVTRLQDTLVAVSNQSGRHVIVEAVVALPQEFADSVLVSSALPTRVENGDSLEFHFQGTYDGAAELVRLFWRFEDENGPGLRETDRRL